MNILIDTQILLLILFKGSELTSKEIEIIKDDKNEIICSSISLFEISLKYSIGKLKLKKITPDHIPALLLKSGYTIKDVNHQTFSSFFKLPLKEHKDPFDRILIWEAIENNWHLMSRDKWMKEYRHHGLKLV